MKQTLALAFGAAIIVGTMIGAPDLSAAEKVSVCHRTGNGGSHIIEIAESAVKAHLAHGDHLGVAGLKSGTPCQPAVGAVQPPPPVQPPAPVVQPPVPPPPPVVQPPVPPPPPVVQPEVPPPPVLK